MEEWVTIITTITTILPFPTNQKVGQRALRALRVRRALGLIWEFPKIRGTLIRGPLRVPIRDL